MSLTLILGEEAYDVTAPSRGVTPAPHVTGGPSMRVEGGEKK